MELNEVRRTRRDGAGEDNSGRDRLAREAGVIDQIVLAKTPGDRRCWRSEAFRETSLTLALVPFNEPKARQEAALTPRDDVTLNSSVRTRSGRGQQ